MQFWRHHRSGQEPGGKVSEGRIELGLGGWKLGKTGNGGEGTKIKRERTRLLGREPPEGIPNAEGGRRKERRRIGGAELG